MNSFPVKKILILVAILALPGFLYYLLKEKGKNRYKPLEFYGPKSLTGAFHTFHGNKIPDTLYYRVPDFSLTNAKGAPVSFLDDTTSIRVVSFFYPGNRNSKLVTASMDKIASEFSDNRLLKFYSILPHPQADDKVNLSALSSEFNAEKKNWQFLTGPDTLVHTIATRHFLLDLLRDSTEADSYIISPIIVLTDPSGRIRGYYDATDPARVGILSDEIKVLITEELRKIKGAN